MNLGFLLVMSVTTETAWDSLLIRCIQGCLTQSRGSGTVHYRLLLKPQPTNHSSSITWTVRGDHGQAISPPCASVSSAVNGHHRSAYFIQGYCRNKMSIIILLHPGRKVTKMAQRASTQFPLKLYPITVVQLPNGSNSKTEILLLKFRLHVGVTSFPPFSVAGCNPTFAFRIFFFFFFKRASGFCNW